MSTPIRTFPDPNPELIAESRTVKPSVIERFIMDKFDPISPDPLEQITGLVLRTSVNISRYEQSAPTEHYRRLIRASKYFAQARLEDAISAGMDPFEVREIIDSFDWPAYPDSVRPIISVQPGDTGIEATLDFARQGHPSAGKQFED